MRADGEVCLREHGGGFQVLRKTRILKCGSQGVEMGKEKGQSSEKVLSGNQKWSLGDYAGGRGSCCNVPRKVLRE